MNYQQIRQGIFMDRPNRFIAHVELEGQIETCHVKNTGRCRELLVPGATVYLEEANKPERKTRFSLIAVKKGPLLINMDSQAPNKAAGEWLRRQPGMELVRPEARYGGSRFDFYLERAGQKAFLEVKGVTLEQNGTALFPDAPTERGVKHLKELCRCVQEGYGTYVLFVIQMKGITVMRPNDQMHPAFGEALREAKGCGVQILAYDCKVTPDSMVLDQRIPVLL